MTLLTICQVQSHREINLKIFNRSLIVEHSRVPKSELASPSPQPICLHSNENLWTSL